MLLLEIAKKGQQTQPISDGSNISEQKFLCISHMFACPFFVRCFRFSRRYPGLIRDVLYRKTLNCRREVTVVIGCNLLAYLLCFFKVVVVRAFRKRNVFMSAELVDRPCSSFQCFFNYFMGTHIVVGVNFFKECA